jgi:hypothetical protein
MFSKSPRHVTSSLFDFYFPSPTQRYKKKKKKNTRECTARSTNKQFYSTILKLHLPFRVQKPMKNYDRIPMRQYNA